MLLCCPLEDFKPNSNLRERARERERERELHMCISETIKEVTVHKKCNKLTP